MENAITRRDALKLGTAATTVIVSGGTLAMLAGCEANSTADSPRYGAPAPSETSFHVENGKWFSDWTEETKQGIAFTGSKLGIVPNGDGETLAIAYCDADGVKQVMQIGPANVPVRVHGDIEMLAADDIASRYVVLRTLRSMRYSWAASTARKSRAASPRLSSWERPMLSFAPNHRCNR